ncbi:hypothetical protein L226DRAFT_328659 [Lentinus tigrinus ALCF2SS1-7]|uniref:uncharacterized protein n=1 Tax=Lentinus tigrinus ALCF2SS1-7 TaxID=1328758 RepID=UPI001165E93D|nr:hypothetical protein L226DRAFT_328659 [Lentinus tigrinus ALCF2SS1-7]
MLGRPSYRPRRANAPGYTALCQHTRWSPTHSPASSPHSRPQHHLAFLFQQP